ncbi:hypothetical protein H8356DRAFT_1420845 [Neocallimastix lanati (nom. inval.)]|uniref:Uncharacterized protein n=1 Tax=Neocallimastix californiae TaxID=1754190 RepID=A0A1Y2D0F1_9FUNG|nr:hypothetical protein H8356DRAFT_1420845 [Neocallimastix sp. JGI-2020a]ORY52759.1 hypothetical protein LY90DRAFT_508115 [Neocallimastix californiae]|eukprot:ORY52759.1 hypothetical protein LY90DRAFT_508115 [Neocallimastix californiae]
MEINGHEDAFFEEMNQLSEMKQEEEIGNINDEREKYIINNGIIGKIILYYENFRDYNDVDKYYVSSYIYNTNIIQLRSINALNDILMIMIIEWYVNNISDVKNIWDWLCDLAEKFSSLLSACINNIEKKILKDIVETIINAM